MAKSGPTFQRDNPKLPTPNANIYRVKLLGQVEGQLTISTFYFRDQNTPATATLAKLTALRDAFNAAGGVNDQYVNCCSSDWTKTGTIIDSPNTPTLQSLFTTSSTVGTGPAGHEPTAVAAVMLRLTAIKGQCGRGHISIPAVPTSWVTLSRVTTLAAYTGLAQKMMLVLSGGGDTFTPALYSRNGSHAFPGVGVADLVAVNFTTLLGTVRRRKIGRGK